MRALVPLLLLACGSEIKPDPRWLDGDGDGWRPGDGDCDDAHASAVPGGSEVCDGLDNDCDGAIDDEPSDGDTWYPDLDGDGFGDPTRPFPACDAASDRTQDDTDCNDDSAAAFPGGVEVCDAVDNDCDGTIDDDASDAVAWHTDRDGDGFGNANEQDAGCDAPSDAVEDGTDCNDENAAIHPGADDGCDGVDNDCDGGEDCALACDLEAAEVLSVDVGPLDGLAFASNLLWVISSVTTPGMIYALDPSSGALVDTFASDAVAAGGLAAAGDELFVPGADIDTYNLISHSWTASVENPCRGTLGGAAALGGDVWQVCALGEGADMVIAGTDLDSGALLGTLAIPESWGTLPDELDADGENLLYVSENPLCDAVVCPTELHIFGTDGAEVCSQELFTDATITVTGLAVGPGAIYLADEAQRRILVFR